MLRKNRNLRIIRNRCLLLLSLIGIFTLSYKGYNYFHGAKVEATKSIITDKVTGADDAKKALPKNDIKTEAHANAATDSGHNINDDGKKYTYDAKKIKDILENKGEHDGKKIAFLTFDDGPSTTVTPKILDVLKNHDVKATFCLVGQNVESNDRTKKLVNVIFKEGHAIGNHTYSHNMKNLYPGNKLNVDYYMEEVDKTNTAIKNIVGQDFNTRMLRMPGGYMSRKHYNDPNLDAFNAKLKERNIYSIDWNAYDFDSEGSRKNADQLLEHVKKSVGTKEKVVILMHDTYGKEETAKALPQIIEYLKNQGYEFKTIS